MHSLYRKITSLLIIIVLIGTSIVPVSTGFDGKFHILEKNQTYSALDFEQNITKIMKQGHMPGLSACIIKNNSVVWQGGYGFYNRLMFWKKPDANTIYGTGSLTKAITATAILQLYEQGRFNLDDDVNNYLNFNLRNPSYPNVPINFTMLLTHQSSLSELIPTKVSMWLANLLGFSKYPYRLLKDYLVPGERYYNPEVWLNTKPGENASYSNIGFTVLAYLVELISGKSFDTYCKEHIFKPLEMMNTSFDDNKLNRKNLAVPYFPFVFSLNKKYGAMIRLPRTRGFHPMLGSTGLMTSTNDLSHFLIAHMNNGIWNGIRILNSSTVELMHTIHIYNVTIPSYNAITIWGYGFGWLFYNRSGTIYQGHYGNDQWGFSSYMEFRDSDNLGVIILMSAWTPEQIESRMLIRQEIFKIGDGFQ